jgi:alkylation response protein AidB-like acyl-CoA dehydrogenase
MGMPKEYGGQGFSALMCFAAMEYFVHNISITAYTNRPIGTADMIASYGSVEQKKRYLGKLISGHWGGPVTATESGVGVDIGATTTMARKQADGSYLISGTKAIITNGESDLFGNMIYTVVARTQGAPAGIGGLSFFLVPKYLVNDDGSQGVRNDYVIGGLENKMGRHGWATCSTVHFGENDKCYGELLGTENMGLFMLLGRMTKAQLGIGLAGTGLASAAYLHALKYAQERIQGAHLKDGMDPHAPKVAIIEHPDIRRMLLWMKAQMEGMRALVYYCGALADRVETTADAAQKSASQGFLDLLTPVCRVYCSDTAFEITEQAMQVFGSYGYFKDFPIEQFMRDVKPESLYEGPNGFQALQLVVMKMGPNGEHLIHLLTEMRISITQYQGIDEVSDLAQDLTARINSLCEVGMFFGKCMAEGKFLVPIANAYPLLNMMGIVTLGWLLFWQAGIAAGKLASMLKRNAVDPGDAAARTAFITENSDAAYYDGKLKAARYYIKHCLPQADGLASAIKSADLSMMDIPDTGF